MGVKVAASHVVARECDAAVENVDAIARAVRMNSMATHTSEKGVTGVTGVTPRVAGVTDGNKSVTGVTARVFGHSNDGGAQLLHDIAEWIAGYVAFPKPEWARIVALWVAHCWLIEQLFTTPRLIFSSPEKRSGKTRAQEVASLLCPNAVNTINVSPAYLFRKLEPCDGEHLPTMFLDETDALFVGRASENTEAVRGIVNAGYRRGATVGRTKIMAKEVVTHDFPVFAPVCLAGIGKLPDTIEDRAIICHMKRRASGERVRPFRDRQALQEAEPLQERLAAWAVGAQKRLAAYAVKDYPPLPDSIQDRDADVWEPLFIVAQLAGGDWLEWLLKTAPDIVRAQHAEPQSLGEMLLRDIRVVFDNAKVDRLPTFNIVSALCALEESPWATLGADDSGIDTRFLTKTLKRYEVGSPHPMKLDGASTRGYYRSDFTDAWQRYLPTTPTDEEGKQE